MKNMRDHKALEPSAIYLRKSREDREAEARGEGDTLERHKKALFRLAKEYGVNILHVFPEVVSGESIVHRPEMMQLLKEVGEGKWRSIFCTDIDRLGRGDMEDQGLILKTFKNSKTLIVTPRKIYDLNDEWDEEYTEFETFMARKELKIITRRLQTGRLRSIEEGNYLGTLPPYGYLIEQNGRRRYLIKNPEQAEPTKIIWNLYQTDYGTNKIANELNQLGYLSYTGKKWTASTILFILKNPVYAGITVWKKKELKKSLVPGKKRDARTRPIEEQVWIHGTHEGYVTEDEFKAVQDKLAKKYHPPYQLTNGLTNPLAGLIRCAICGASMVLRPYSHQKYPHLICYNRHCPNKSTRFEFAEKAVLNGLRAWLNAYREQWDKGKPDKKNNSTIEIKRKVLQNLQRELKELDLQKDRLHELLERQIYDEETYLERSKKLSERIAEAKTGLSEAENILVYEIKREEAQKDIIPKVEQILGSYDSITDPAVKNRMLKTVLEYAIYKKEKHQQGDDFVLELYPKLPQ